MSFSPLPARGLPEPPWPEFHAELEELARHLAVSGDETGGARLAAANARWWAAQMEWVEAVAELMRMHHEINNALVGVSGNAQLLMMSPVGKEPRGRERLEVILREAGRITQAARALSELRAQLRAETPGIRGSGRIGPEGGSHVRPRG